MAMAKYDMARGPKAARENRMRNAGRIQSQHPKSCASKVPGHSASI